MVETGREGFGKAGSEPMDLSEKKSCSVGSEWVYIFNRRKAKKEISADHNQWTCSRAVSRSSKQDSRRDECERTERNSKVLARSTCEADLRYAEILVARAEGGNSDEK